MASRCHRPLARACRRQCGPWHR